MDKTFKKRTASILLSTFVMAVAVAEMKREINIYFPDWVHGEQLLKFGLLTALICAGGLIFSLLVLITGGVNLKELKARLLKRRG